MILTATDYIQMLDKMPEEVISKIIPNGWIHYLAMHMERDGQIHPYNKYKTIRGISKKVLHDNLNRMLMFGFATKTVVMNGKMKEATYELTDLGRSYLPIMNQYIQWFYDHYSEMLENRERYIALNPEGLDEVDEESEE